MVCSGRNISSEYALPKVRDAKGEETQEWNCRDEEDLGPDFQASTPGPLNLASHGGIAASRTSLAELTKYNIRIDLDKPKVVAESEFVGASLSVN
jgi:hypothetical protein